MSCEFQADSFFNAYLILSENINKIQQEMRILSDQYKTLPVTHQPKTIQIPTMRQTIGVNIVCLAFSLELYLKDAHFANGKAIRGHKITKLFNALPVKTQSEIYDIYVKNGQTCSKEEFRSRIETISDGFEKWRYLHEVEYASYHDGFVLKLIEAIKTVTKAIRAETNDQPNNNS